MRFSEILIFIFPGHRKSPTLVRIPRADVVAEQNVRNESKLFLILKFRIALFRLFGTI